MEKYHPGTCEATARGKRYGTNLTPQRFDDPGHTWARAKTVNWGPWSCCGRAVNSKGCQQRAARQWAVMPPAVVLPASTAGMPTRGVGAYVQFLISGKDRVLVVGQDSKCWLLSSGRVAKKATEGSSWIWDQGGACDGLSHLLSRLRVNELQHCYYSFGNWGYHTNEHESQIMPGFSPTPPGAEICGKYNIIYVAALRYDTGQQRANIYLRRQPERGTLVISKSRLISPFTVGVSGRLGTANCSGRVTSKTVFEGAVSLPSHTWDDDIDNYFGPGYNFYGFGANSEATLSYPSMASNAALIVTKRNDNKGRLYRVDNPKAFKLVQSEVGVVADERASSESQEQEAIRARRICKCRHFSFLCQELGLPCSASALVTAFVTDAPPFIFAEPGDIWIDIRLTTPNRTYVLARRK